MLEIRNPELQLEAMTKTDVSGIALILSIAMQRIFCSKQIQPLLR
jgi:hypothetical protein